MDASASIRTGATATPTLHPRYKNIPFHSRYDAHLPHNFLSLTIICAPLTSESRFATFTLQVLFLTGKRGLICTDSRCGSVSVANGVIH